MIKKVCVVIVVFCLITLLVLSPYFSSFVFIYFINDYLPQKLDFGFSSYFVFIENWLNRAEYTNRHLLTAIEYGSYAFFVPFLLPVLFTVFGLISFLMGEKRSVHGNARLANDIDLSKSPFFKKADKNERSYPPILIGQVAKGKYKDRYIQYRGQQFLMLYAPTRSGKGVGKVIPNCLHYSESIVVLDIKLENFMYSAGHRKNNLGQEVHLFCPGGWEKMGTGVLRSSRFNPLAYINRSLTYRIADTARISGIMFPKTGGDNDMWVDLTDNLFQGLVLFLLDCENETNEDGSLKYKVTMSEVLKLAIPQSGESLGDFLKKEVETRNSEENLKAWNRYVRGEGERPRLNRLDEETVRFLLQFANNPERQQLNILLTFFAEMKVFSNPITAAATDGNDFDLGEVRRKKMSIYYGLSPDDLGLYQKLTNLFFSLFISENIGMNKLPEQDPTLKYQCLAILDEFISLGKMKIIKDAVAFSAGYNIRFMFILQDRSQLEDKDYYGKEGAETLISNCAVEIVYPPKDVNDHVKRVSESLGYYDMKLNKVSKSRGKQSSSNHSTDKHKRAVLLPQEIVDLREETHPVATKLSIKQLILSEFCRPILANKIVYFDDPYFLKRKIYSENNIPEIPVLEIPKNEVMDKVVESFLVDTEIKVKENSYEI